MKRIMKKTAALFCAAALTATAGGGELLRAYADEDTQIVTMNFNDDPTDEWIEVSGNINISDYPDGAKLKLVGDTVLNVNADVRLSELGNENKYNLTLKGSKELKCSDNIMADHIEIYTKIVSYEICGTYILLSGNTLRASEVSCRNFVINDGNLSAKDQTGLNVYGSMTINSGYADIALFSGRQLKANGGTVSVDTLNLQRTDRHMSNWGWNDRPASNWHDCEPLTINAPAHLDSEKLETKYEFEKEGVGGEDYYCNAVRTAWVVDKKGKTPKNVKISSTISGTIRIDRESNIVPGTKLKVIKEGIIKDIPDDALTFTWARSKDSHYPDSSAEWVAVGYDNEYYAQADDVGHYVRAMVTMKGAGGGLVTPPKPVNKSKCYIDVERANTSYRDDTLYITNGKTVQEYLVLSEKKDISSLTEADWKNAVTPEDYGEFKVNCTQDRINYIYTRAKESPSMFAGTDVICSQVYCGNFTQLQDMNFVVDPVGENKIKYEGSYVIGKVNEPIKINVVPLPGNATNFNGVRGDMWLLNGYNYSSNPDGSFYEDEACTKQVVPDKQYMTVYLKCTKPANNYTVAAQYTRGYNDMVYSSFNLRIADINGKLKAESISIEEVELPIRYNTTYGFEPNVYPKGGDISDITFKCNNTEATAPKVYLNKETGYIFVEAGEAAIGTYYYDAYIGDNKLLSYIKVNIIKDTVTIHFDPGSGSGEMQDMEVAIGSEMILPSCAFTPPEKYFFEEWVVDADDCGYAVGDTYIVYDDIVFRAGWHPCEHKLQKAERVAPTCQTEGIKEHYVCPSCGYRYSDSEGNNKVSYEDLVIPKLPHNWDGGKITTKATETDPGVITFTCLVCGETKDVPYTLGNEDKILVKKGDVNNDDKIDIEDAVMVINHVNGVTALTDDEIKRADIDGNSVIDIEDAVAIIAHVNGIKSIE